MATNSSCCNNANDKNTQLHIAIIGSGSGAFSCAIKAAENGARVTLIEAANVIGGCCVNVGCVPSKILIRAAELAEQQRKNPFDGLKNNIPKIDRALLSKQQQNRVDELAPSKVSKYFRIKYCTNVSERVCKL
ncbi:MAG: FAD-dependent oxidoreductase [Enterobacterales bacterium]|nr:FAD-dependent oxidoreductase [Enterobacterales bacterium]